MGKNHLTIGMRALVPMTLTGLHGGNVLLGEWVRECQIFQIVIAADFEIPAKQENCEKDTSLYIHVHRTSATSVAQGSGRPEKTPLVCVHLNPRHQRLQ